MRTCKNRQSIRDIEYTLCLECLTKCDEFNAHWKGRLSAVNKLAKAEQRKEPKNTTRNVQYGRDVADKKLFGRAE